MNLVCGMKSEAAHLFLFQDVQHLQQCHPAGGWRRHCKKFITAIRAAEWCSNRRLVRLQILGGEDASVRFQLFKDQSRGFSLIEVARVGLQSSQHCSEFRLAELIALLEHCAIVQENAFGLREER